MQKIITGKEVRLLDQAYTKGEKISSFQLMERAANAFCDWFKTTFTDKTSVAVFCGTGNNGGDGLAIARMLALAGYKVRVFTVGDLDKGSADFKKNREILPEEVGFAPWDNEKEPDSEILIDGVFGVGINRPLEGDYLEYTNTKIRVKVPTVGYIDNSDDLYSGDEINDGVACTGKVRVCKDRLFKCWCFVTSEDEL